MWEKVLIEEGDGNRDGDCDGDSDILILYCCYFKSWSGLLYSGFLAALSSSRTLVVSLSVCLSVDPSVRDVCEKWPLEYQKVIKTYLPTNPCDSSYSSDSSDSSDSSARSYTKNHTTSKKNHLTNNKNHATSPQKIMQTLHKKITKPLYKKNHATSPPKN